MKSYQDLDVWKKAVDLSVKVYELTSRFPESERYGLVTQVRRAAVSIAANIAEGTGRSSPREFVQFLGIARGSLHELETHFIIAERLGLMKGGEAPALRVECANIGRMLYRLMATLKAR